MSIHFESHQSARSSDSMLCVPCRADRRLRDFGAMLPNEGALVPWGAQVMWAHTQKFWPRINITEVFCHNVVKFTFIFTSFPSTTYSNSGKDETSKQKMQTDMGRLPRLLQFLFVTGILMVVGSRVASLVVLEFCLRAISGWLTAGPVRHMPDTCADALL